MQQSMIRVKDPEASLKFYCEGLGFNLVMYRDFPVGLFGVLCPPVDPATIPKTSDEQWGFCMKTPGCIELTWNYGSEKEEGKVYNTGNSDPTGSTNGEKVRGGFGHLGITVPDVYEASARFAELGYEFTKTPNGGGMKQHRLRQGPRRLPHRDPAAGADDHEAGRPRGRRRRGRRDRTRTTRSRYGIRVKAQASKRSNFAARGTSSHVTRLTFTTTPRSQLHVRAPRLAAVACCR